MIYKKITLKILFHLVNPVYLSSNVYDEYSFSIEAFRQNGEFLWKHLLP